MAKRTTGKVSIRYGQLERSGMIKVNEKKVVNKMVVQTNNFLSLKYIENLASIFEILSLSLTEKMAKIPKRKKMCRTQKLKPHCVYDVLYLACFETILSQHKKNSNVI